MTPKEKAKELVEGFKSYANHYIYFPSDYPIDEEEKETEKKVVESAKQCALICVDEILKTVDRYEYGQGEIVVSTDYAYWQEVKQEINKL